MFFLKNTPSYSENIILKTYHMAFFLSACLLEKFQHLHFSQHFPALRRTKQKAGKFLQIIFLLFSAQLQMLAMFCSHTQICNSIQHKFCIKIQSQVQIFLIYKELKKSNEFAIKYVYGCGNFKISAARDFNSIVL